MNKFKQRALLLFWLPAWFRVCWRKESGRFFIFRDESNEFLRYLWFINTEPGAVRGDVQELLDMAMEEIAARQRTGAWTC